MNTVGKDVPLNTDESVEQAVERILGKASPRPVPSIEETQAVRDEVRTEWLALTNKRRVKRRLISWSIAASILVVVFAGFNTVRLGGMAETPVASIAKSFGSIYMLGDNSELLESNNVSVVTAGQTIITDAASGIGFAWAEGGSLRIDADTRVEFLSRDSIYLRSGRVYFDSQPDRLTGVPDTAAKLTIMTDYGAVTHVGTQYMTTANADTLTISVREGEVRVENPSLLETASGGQQLQVRGGMATNVVNFKPYGDSWQWIEKMSPVADVEGRSLYDFLGWVSHETGLTLKFADDAVERFAKEDLLIGTVDTDPTSALTSWMLTNDLEWKIEDGMILIDGDVDSSSQPSKIRN